MLGNMNLTQVPNYLSLFENPSHMESYCVGPRFIRGGPM